MKKLLIITALIIGTLTSGCYISKQPRVPKTLEQQLRACKRSNLMDDHMDKGLARMYRNQFQRRGR